MTNESDVGQYGTPNWVFVYFNSVIKRVKQFCCTLILLPKSTLNANLTTTNRFFTNDYWQRGRFENFESYHQYESNLESDVRFEIESNHEATQVPSLDVDTRWWILETLRWLDYIYSDDCQTTVYIQSVQLPTSRVKQLCVCVYMVNTEIDRIRCICKPLMVKPPCVWHVSDRVLHTCCRYGPVLCQNS